MLSKIADTLHLARYVEYVEVVNTTMLWVHSFHKWEFYFFRGLLEMLLKLETLVTMAEPRLGIGSTFAQSAELGVVGLNDAHTLHDTKRAYGRYRYWVDGQNQIRRMNKRGLAHTVDWSKLSRLRGIDTLEGRDVVNIPARTNRSGKNIIVDRRVIDTCLP